MCDQWCDQCLNVISDVVLNCDQTFMDQLGRRWAPSISQSSLPQAAVHSMERMMEALLGLCLSSSVCSCLVDMIAFSHYVKLPVFPSLWCDDGAPLLLSTVGYVTFSRPQMSLCQLPCEKFVSRYMSWRLSQ